MKGDTMRDKLIDLLLEVDSVCEVGECSECSAGDCYIHRAADHLIAHGLTFATDNNVTCKWIPVSERMPTEEENESLIIGIVNGYNGRIKFNDAAIQVRYDHKEKAWWSENYDIEGCKVSQWYLVPEPPKEGD